MMNIEKISAATKYIEENIHHKLTLQNIAGSVYTSPYYFHRLFYSIARETLGDYIRKRRLTLAAEELAKTDNKIINISLNYCYNSHEAFTRAFSSYFGLSPYEYRKTGKINSLLLKPPLEDTSLHHILGGVTIEPIILKLDTIKVVGIKDKTSLTNNKLSELWGRFLPRIGEVENRIMDRGCYGICLYNPDLEIKDINDDMEYEMLTAVEVRDFEKIPDGMMAYSIPPREYAVFTHKGNISNLGLTYSYIYFNWLEKEGYTIIEGDDFECYGKGFNLQDPSNSEIKIYIPIKRQ